MSEEAKLRWRCRRGMREMDLLLGGYLESRYSEASATTQQAFREILEELDQDIYNWVMGRTTCPDQYRELVHQLQQLTNSHHPKSN